MSREKAIEKFIKKGVATQKAVDKTIAELKEQQSEPPKFRQIVTCALLDCRSDEQQLKVALKLLHQSEDIIDQQAEENKQLQVENKRFRQALNCKEK